MGLFMDLLGPAVGATYNPWDDFWYQKDPRGTTTHSGYPVSADTAMRLSTVYSCVGLISDMIGSLPLLVYRRLDNGGKERARMNPLFNLLHRQPNPRQTAKEWRTMGAEHLLLRGNFYNRIVLDGRFAVAALEPLSPDRVTVRVLDSGRRGYLYRPPSGPAQTFTQDEIFHVMGRSLDGVMGCSVIEYARESIGAAQAQEGFAATFWRQGAEGHLAFVAPGDMSEKTRKENETAIQSRIGGWQNAHKPILLSGGLKPERISVTGRDSQYLESRNFSVADVARFFRVMPDWLGVEGNWATGTGIEQRMIQLVNFTLLPWLITIEQSIDRDLILDERHFAEFLVDALLRGDMASRAQAYSIYVMNGIMSENEVRIRENLNPRPGLDEPRRSVNQDRGGDPRQLRPAGMPERRTPMRPTDDDEEENATQASRIVREVAGRLVRKEAAAIRKWAPRFAADPVGWQKWVVDFYALYAFTLETALAMSPQMAREYCDRHSAALIRDGVTVAEKWEHDQPGLLAELALSQNGRHHG